MGEAGEIAVEVAYAEPDCQIIVSLALPAGTSAGEAVQRSGLLERFSIEWPGAAIGVFGRKVDPATVLDDGDRVEIYRPLAMDPKSARRLRAARSGTRPRR